MFIFNFMDYYSAVRGWRVHHMHIDGGAQYKFKGMGAKSRKRINKHNIDQTVCVWYGRPFFRL